MSAMSKRTCTKCRITKPVEQFRKKTSDSGGRESRCKKCVSRIQYDPHQTHRSCKSCKQSKLMTEFHLDKKALGGHKSHCKVCTNAKTRKNVNPYRSETPAMKLVMRCRKYGITVERYWQAYHIQLGHCGICGEIGGKDGLGIDHDHASQQFRGLLCVKCNLLLGYANDNIEVLFNAIKYLTTRKSS